MRARARPRDEFLDGEIFYTLREAQIVIENWRRHYNAVRPHASLGYKAPASRRVPAGTRRKVNYATPTSFTAHDHAGATTRPKPTFPLDHSMGAGHRVSLFRYLDQLGELLELIERHLDAVSRLEDVGVLAVMIPPYIEDIDAVGLHDLGSQR